MKKYLSFCIVLGLASCGVKTKLSPSELAWINVYQAGDTLVFQSDKGQLDTSVILKTELFYPEYNPVELHGKYLPQHGVVWYRNRYQDEHSNGARMVSMHKPHPRKPAWISISYKVAGDGFKSSQEELRTRWKDSVYQVRSISLDPKPGDVSVLHWHPARGLIYYEQFNGTKWRIIREPVGRH